MCLRQVSVCCPGSDSESTLIVNLFITFLHTFQLFWVLFFLSIYSRVKTELKRVADRIICLIDSRDIIECWNERKNKENLCILISIEEQLTTV